MRFLLFLCLFAVSLPGASRANLIDLHLLPDSLRWGDPVIAVLVGQYDPSCSQVDSVLCSRPSADRLEMDVLIRRTHPICLLVLEPYAETCIFELLYPGEYTLVAKVFYDDLSAQPRIVDSLSFSIKPPTATRVSSWGHVRSLFR